MRKSLASFLFLGSFLMFGSNSYGSNSYVERTDTFAVKIPYERPFNLICYYGGVGLYWEGQDGVWKNRETSEYNFLWERKTQSCGQIGTLQNIWGWNGYLNASVDIHYFRDQVCWGGHYGTEKQCEDMDQRNVDVRLENLVTVSRSEIMNCGEYSAGIVPGCTHTVDIDKE